MLLCRLLYLILPARGQHVVVEAIEIGGLKVDRLVAVITAGPARNVRLRIVLLLTRHVGCLVGMWLRCLLVCLLHLLLLVL